MSLNLNINTNTAQKKRARFPAVLLDGNTVGWYDSQIIGTGGVTKDGSDFVSKWEDRLLSGHDLLQAVGTNQPKWFSVDGILFDGIDNFMKTAAFTFNQPEMIYIVFKQVTWMFNGYIIDGNAGDSGILWEHSTTPGIKAFAGTASTQNNNLVVNTFGIIRVLFNGVSGKLIINDTTPVTGDFGASNMGGFTLGSRAAATNFSNIQVKEAILRNAADGATDEQDIYNYLSKKYGI